MSSAMLHIENPIRKTEGWLPFKPHPLIKKNLSFSCTIQGFMFCSINIEGNKLLHGLHNLLFLYSLYYSKEVLMWFS